MSIEKKSLISTLKSAKKANVVKDEMSFDNRGLSAVKAQPVVKLVAKASKKLVYKTARKTAVKN